MKRLLRILFRRGEDVLSYAFGPRNNPLMCLGALGWYFFWIAAATGIYLYIFFDTGIVDAYASVEYMTHQQWYAAGIMRSLHRYASDAIVVIAVLHMLREFSLDRLRGKRFFAWRCQFRDGWLHVVGVNRGKFLESVFDDRDVLESRQVEQCIALMRQRDVASADDDAVKRGGDRFLPSSQRIADQCQCLTFANACAERRLVQHNTAVDRANPLGVVCGYRFQPFARIS